MKTVPDIDAKEHVLQRYYHWKNLRDTLPEDFPNRDERVAHFERQMEASLDWATEHLNDARRSINIWMKKPKPITDQFSSWVSCEMNRLDKIVDRDVEVSVRIRCKEGDDQEPLHIYEPEKLIRRRNEKVLKALRATVVRLEKIMEQK